MSYYVNHGPSVERKTLASFAHSLAICGGRPKEKPSSNNIRGVSNRQQQNWSCSDRKATGEAQRKKAAQEQCAHLFIGIVVLSLKPGCVFWAALRFINHTTVRGSHYGSPWEVLQCCPRRFFTARHNVPDSPSPPHSLRTAWLNVPSSSLDEHFWREKKGNHFMLSEGEKKGKKRRKEEKKRRKGGKEEEREEKERERRKGRIWR